MFVSEAFAQTAGATNSASGMDNLVQFAPILGLIVLFYFLMIRPQQKKLKAHRELVSQLRRGDRVLTQGGLVGVVAKVLSDTEISVEIAEGVRVKFLRSAVTEVLEKTTPVSGGTDASNEDGAEEPSAGTTGGRKSSAKRSS